MVRFKRYSRRGRRSTGIIRMKIQSFMDISTTDTSMQIITISAGGHDIVQRLGAQFAAYKYYKIGNISVKLVPASTLPVDPTGLSITAGDNLVDPRDQLTPGMMRITNGEDIFENITGLTDDQQHQIYNTMLLDPRWFKWMLQSGVKRHATPRYWQIGQLHQDKWPGSVENIPNLNSSANGLTGTKYISDSFKAGTGEAYNVTSDGSSPYGLFQVGHRGVLGWLPTDGLTRQIAQPNNAGNVGPFPLVASPPEVEVMKIILPKAYKTRYWYRAFITETVYFREPIVNFGLPNASGYDLRPIDVFHAGVWPTPALPTTAYTGTHPLDSESGGNYGDD